MWQIVLTEQQTGGPSVYHMGGTRFGMGSRDFDIYDLNVDGFVPGNSLREQTSFIVMALCAGVL